MATGGENGLKQEASEQRKMGVAQQNITEKQELGSSAVEISGSEENVSETLKPFDLAVAQLLCWSETEPAGLRVRSAYRNLFACLTPRQIKSFLRERLLDVMDSPGRGASKSDVSPLTAILRTLFHPIWRLWRDERDLFQALSIAAGAAVRLSDHHSDRGRELGRLSGAGAEFFYRQLQAIIAKSDGLSEEDLPSCWPKKTKERALLIYLLQAIDEPVPNPKQVFLGRGLGGQRSLQSYTMESELERFADWVEKQVGQRLRGASIQEQVVSFQEIIRGIRAAGEGGMTRLIRQYVNEFLASHLRFFNASIAPVLSNLAVLIESEAGSEVECDELFKVAVGLARPGTLIPLYYVEFLLDVSGDKARRERLENETEKTIVQLAQEILDSVQVGLLDSNARFYLGTLKFRLSRLAGGDDAAGDGVPATGMEDQVRDLWTFVKDQAAVLVKEDREPLSRLNRLLDQVIGTGDNALGWKVPLQAAIWAARVKNGEPGWPMATLIANDLVGEGKKGAPLEALGMRMNGALVVDRELLAANETQRLAAIWSQTAVLLATNYGKAALSRIALAFSLSLSLGASGESLTRMRRVFESLGLGSGGTEADDWTPRIDADHRALLTALRKGDIGDSPVSESALKAIRNAVFEPEYSPYVASPEALGEAMDWNADTFSWAANQKFEEVVAELLPQIAKSKF